MGSTASSTRRNHDDTDPITEMPHTPRSTNNPGLPPRPRSPFPPLPMVNARAGPGPSTIARAASISKNEEKEEGEISDEDDEIQYLPGPPTPFKRAPAPSRPSANSSQNRPPTRESKTERKVSKQAAKNAKKNKQASSVKSAPPRLPPAPLPPPRQSPPILVETRREIATLGANVSEPASENATASTSSIAPISSSDAIEQEKEIIRGLIREGYSATDVMSGGANPKHVSAVCQEILAAKAAKAKLQGQVLPTPITQPNQLPANPSPILTRLSAPMGRQTSRASQSSQTSEEGLVDSMMGPASPKDGSSKMIASSSWYPLPPPPVTAYPFVPPPPPVRIESYRPPTPPGRPPPDAPTSLSSNGSQASTTLTATMRNFHPLSSYSGPPSIVPIAGHQANPYLPPPPLPQQHHYLPPPQQNHYLPPPQPQIPYFPQSQANVQLAPPQPNPYLNQIQQSRPPIQPLPHRASLPPKPPAPASFGPGPGPPMLGLYPENNRSYPPQNGQMAVTLPNPYPFANPPIPVTEQTPSPRLVESELAARTALLETRRKAFESMKKRREANRPAQPVPSEPVPTPVDMSLLDDTPIIIDDDEDSVPDKTIEEQMAELEEEVMGLQNQQAMELAAADAQDDIDMEIESTEDGEIEDIPEPVKPPISASSTPILSVPSLTLSSGSSTAVKIPSRGTKRLNAEDMMDNRPSTMPARLNPHKRRSLFGGMPQRPNRLMMLVDQPDSDSEGDDDDNDPQMAKLKISSGNTTPNDTAKLLAEKEDGIRKLREQIERRLKAKLAKRVAPVIEVKREQLEVKMEGPVEEIAETVAEVKQVEPVVEVKQEIDVDMEDSSEPAAVATGADVTLPVEHLESVVSDVTTTDQVMEVTASPISCDSELPTTQQTLNPYFRSFTPLLPRYPQLQVTPTTTVSTIPRQLEATSARRVDDIDQNLLVSIILTRRLQKEPELMLCAAETAGGCCADITCGDLHLVKGMLSDDDLVEYLAQIHPGKERSDLIAKLGAAKSVSGYGQGGSSARITQQVQKGKGKSGSAIPLSNGDDSRIDMVDVKGLVSRVGRLIAAE